MMKHRVIVASFIVCLSAIAIQPDKKTLPIGLAPHETTVEREIPAQTQPPVGPIRSLAEWEEADAAMTLWVNPSLVSALVKRGPVKLIADGRNEENWWRNWLKSNGISDTQVSFFQIPTNSIWIRDYGPWFILDGKHQFGIVDTKYNRPRPLDDLVPEYIAKELGVPIYQPGLVHTGGNYYNDALSNAFSSTLVYTENSSLGNAEVDKRMRNYLGIERYTTSRLAPGMTIEHIDTFGKLVSPDTWVFSDFPQGSPFRVDSENMVTLLKTLKSPYGTPYKIHRLKMVGGGGYRAYINSFISNKALYFPAYGDSIDNEVATIYQKALPGYDIVPVSTMGTQWGDSVHCRMRNLLRAKTIFLFPTVEKAASGEIVVNAEVLPSPGHKLVGNPSLHWSVNGVSKGVLPMEKVGGENYAKRVPAPMKGAKLSFWIEAKDSSGKQKTAPLNAPQMTIDWTE